MPMPTAKATPASSSEVDTGRFRYMAPMNAEAASSTPSKMARAAPSFSLY